MFAVLHISLLLGLGLPSYTPLTLHELIARADLCFVGEIVRVDAETIDVVVQHRGFGDFTGDTVRVQRFEDWVCAERWTPYAVGQRCLYFLDVSAKGNRILSAGGEGECPVVGRDLVRPLAKDAREAFGEAHLPFPELFRECQRYRERFELVAGKRWIQARVPEAEIEEYGRSSPLAAQLCRSTFATAGAGYRDPAARTPRPAEPGRVDLGVGPCPWGLLALPDLDGDGGGELLATQRDSLAFLRFDRSGAIRARTWLWGTDWRECTALACVGDLEDDHSLEVAVSDSSVREDDGPSGCVRILSLGPEGELARERRIRLSDPAFGTLDPETDEFGAGLAALGDLDADGTFELAVSAGGREVAGSIWLLSVDFTGAALRARRVVARSDGLLGPLRLAAPGDIDGDGNADLAVVAQEKHGKGTPGAVHVFFLERDGSVRRRVVLRGTEDPRPGVLRNLTAAGDCDGDGVPDLVVSALGDALRVLLLERGGAVRREFTLAPPGPPLPERSKFGAALALSSVGGRSRLLCAGLSWVEAGKESWQTLRVYPSVWSFDLAESARAAPR